jgi:tetratricopeptide (TPR) repeat protein
MKRYSLSIIFSAFSLIILFGQSSASSEQQINIFSSFAKGAIEAESYINNGYKCYTLGLYPEAILNYTKAIEISPTFAIAYTKRGETYLRMGQHSEAMLDFDKAIEINPKNIEAYLYRGISYIRNIQYDKAISDLNRVIEINPESAIAYNFRGFAYIEGKRQYDDAISDFNQAIKMQPKFAQAYNNRGYAYYFNGEYKKAWDDVNKAQDLGHPVNSKFLMSLQKALGKMGDI